MKIFPGNLALALVAAGLAASGCGKGGDSPTAADLSAAPGVVKSAFSKSSAEVQAAAAKAAEDIASGNYVESVGDLGELSSRTDLTPEQRQALAQSQIAVMQKLSEAAANGDQKAAEAMELHRARK